MNQHSTVFTPLDCERRTHVETTCAIYHAGVKPHTKRRDMASLSPGWRERVVARMSIVGGVLVALIGGAKVDVLGGKRQEWRRPERPLEHDSSLVQDLAGEVRRAVGSLVVTISSASNFSKSVSNAAARARPRRKTAVTPYYFRHQVAADMKADGQLGSGEISAALGHLSDATKSTYGHANMSKGRGVAPARVSAARPVKARAKEKVKLMRKAKK